MGLAPATNPIIDAPALRPGLVRRAALLERLAAVADVPLALLVAPPGYGKTTALAQWVEQDPRSAAWVTVEEADNDPRRLLDRIASALPDGAGSLAPRLGEPTVRDLTRRIRALGTPVVVALDDVHHLRRGPAPNLLVQLATELPVGSQLTVAGRSAAALRVGRLRAERRCVEFGPADLAFDVEEAGQALALAGVPADGRELRLLVERAEGWPAGVYLTALAQRYEVALPTAPGHVTGDDAYISDYFRDELLARLPPDTVRFLLRTAVLDRLCASLCDAALGATDSAARLADIEQRNLFVVPLDRHREWYRYHRLFSQTLVAELGRREPGEERRVHRRAAAWYEQRGVVEESFRHRIAGGDLATAGRLATQYGAALIDAGRIATLRGWVESLGEDAPLAYPPVAVTAAWTAALSGETGRAQSLLLAAERASFSGPLPDGHTSLESATALLRAMMGAQGVDCMLADAQRALALEPPGTPWNPLAESVLGVALVLAGGPEEAAGHLERVALLGRDQFGTVTALALAQLSLLAADRRDAAAAHRYAATARDHLAAGHTEERTTAVATFVAGANAALLRGAHEEARRQLGTAVRHYFRVPPTAFPWLAAQSALVLGTVSLGLDDLEAARHRLDDARRHLARLPVAGVLPGRVEGLAAAVTRAGDPSAPPSPMALTEAEERVLRLLPTHLSLGEIGEELHVSRNTVKTHVGAVYRKLQATTRTEAVRHGRELGLLAH